MNRENYVQLLEQKSDYCNCEGLQVLFNHARKAKELEARCDFFEENVDLENPKPEDLPALRDYKEAIKSRDVEVGGYYKELSRLGKGGELKFKIHDFSRGRALAEISYERTTGYLTKERTPVITIHCSNCDAQIDLIARG